MSRPVEEFEISALIDGELDATRAAEVRSIIERDPSLQMQFEHLVDANRAWTAAAKSAQFVPAEPNYELARSPSGAYVWIASGLAFILAAGRCFPKFIPGEMAVGILLHALMLIGLIAVVVRLNTVAEESDSAPS